MILRTLLLLSFSAFPLIAADSLAERISHPKPDSYRDLTGVHAGAGGMSFSTLMRAGTIENLRFIHRGVINPKSGIGHHMHNSTEEMFVVFGGNVQFTINGHTAEAKGPVGVPVRLGQSRALYNAGDEPVQWMNISINRSDMPALGRGEDPTGSVDLGDDRVGALLDRVPAFLTAPFDRSMLRRLVARIPPPHERQKKTGGRHEQKTETPAEFLGQPGDDRRGRGSPQSEPRIHQAVRQRPA